MLPKRGNQKHIFESSSGLTRAKKSKNGSKLGPKYKMARYGAKLDFKGLKIHRRVVKQVFHLNKSARSIFLTAVRLNGPYNGQKEQKGVQVGSKIQNDML